MIDLIPRLAGRRILVVGDLMLDTYLWGQVRRVSPEAPVPVVELLRRCHYPGGAANVAANVASLGGVPALAGVVGADNAGRLLREQIAQRGVALAALLEDAARPTTTKTRIVAFNQQIVRLDEEVAFPLAAELEGRLLDQLAAALADAEACILADYAKGVVTTRVAEVLIAWGRERGRPVLVDPKGPQAGKYRGAMVVKPNLSEAEVVLRRRLDREEVLSVGEELLGEFGSEAVLLTRGAEGMVLFRRGQPPRSIATQPRQVFDVTGAGDTAMAALALAVAAGASLEEAAALANEAAGIVVGKPGTAGVTPAELLAAVQR
ncbi:MAG: D-glycero-beta-D-manno-heptose-7-phosphate kinase [Gemmataceae bacterium]|nr:D-glycero-beta-D-manno-heptose-7-phosphate kinase [Gemmataceae bacterium]MDW8267434.1 D-glycero-beta-D-manno-heptose-7-phosphate kinase [Gemmataceae bacterium]